MRVITGLARGRKLETLEWLDVRPTTGRVKEAIFSAIQFDIEGRRVLDLFAGSGQLGIEALSRGAALCVFVDASQKACDVVKRNLAAAGLSASARVLCTDALGFLAGKTEEFDVEFLDPPYGTGLLGSALKAVERRMSCAGVIFCEHRPEEALPESVGAFMKARVYRHGKIAVTLYRREMKE